MCLAETISSELETVEGEGLVVVYFATFTRDFKVLTLEVAHHAEESMRGAQCLKKKFLSMTLQIFQR